MTAPRKAEPRTAPFADTDLARAWEAFINDHASLHLLANAMRMSPPARTAHDAPVFKVTHSSVQIGFIREYLHEITAYIRDRLSNDSVTFELVEVEEDSPLAWNDRELIRHIIADTPALADFSKKLQLKLI